MILWAAGRCQRLRTQRTLNLPNRTRTDGGRDDSGPRSYPQGFFTPAPRASQILLIRHGQSAAYVPGRPFPLVDGHGDPHLSELGHYQARLVADRLASEPISSIYVSTLTRTHQTAAPLAETLGLEPRVEPDLREVFLGEAEGGVLREMFANGHPVTQRLRRSRDLGVIPGAESNAKLTDRTVGAVNRIVDRHQGEMVAVFCHGGVIAALLQHAAKAVTGAFFGARHTSINHLVVQHADSPAEAETVGTTSNDEPQWIIRSFNDGAHAGGLTADHIPGG